MPTKLDLNHYQFKQRLNRKPGRKRPSLSGLSADGWFSGSRVILLFQKNNRPCWGITDEGLTLTGYPSRGQAPEIPAMRVTNFSG